MPKHYHFVSIQRASKNHPAQGLHRTWFQHCGRWRRGRHFRVFHPRRWASGSQRRAAARRSNLISKCFSWAVLTATASGSLSVLQGTHREVFLLSMLWNLSCKQFIAGYFGYFALLEQLLLVLLAFSWEWDFSLLNATYTMVTLQGGPKHIADLSIPYFGPSSSFIFPKTHYWVQGYFSISPFPGEQVVGSSVHRLPSSGHSTA